MTSCISIISSLFVPLMVVAIVVFGLIKKKPIYELFVEGAKDGLRTAVEILPFVLAIFAGIKVFTTSGAMGAIVNAGAGLCSALNIPDQLLSLILLRPVSGSGSLIMTQQIMESCGPDSYAGRTAAVMTGSCETVFYVLALYFGVTAVKYMRHTLITGLIGYFAGVIVSIYICKII